MTRNSLACFSASRLRSFLIFSISRFNRRPISITVSFTASRAASMFFSTSFLTVRNIRFTLFRISFNVLSVNCRICSTISSRAPVNASRSSPTTSTPLPIIPSIFSPMASMASFNFSLQPEIISRMSREAFAIESSRAESTRSIIPPAASSIFAGSSSKSNKNSLKSSFIEVSSSSHVSLMPFPMSSEIPSIAALAEMFNRSKIPSGFASPSRDPASSANVELFTVRISRIISLSIALSPSVIAPSPELRPFTCSPNAPINSSFFASTNPFDLSISSLAESMSCRICCSALFSILSLLVESCSSNRSGNCSIREKTSFTAFTPGSFSSGPSTNRLLFRTSQALSYVSRTRFLVSRVVRFISEMVVRARSRMPSVLFSTFAIAFEAAA